MPKPGRLSQAEKAYIAANVGRMHPQAIADTLDRKLDLVLKAVADLPPDPAARAMSAEQEARSAIKAELKLTWAWRQLTLEFETDEVAFFEESYCAMMAQFRDNVLATEQSQVFKTAKYEVLMARNLRAQKRLNAEITRKEAEQDRLVQAGRTDEAIDVETQLVGLHATLQSKSKEYAELDRQHQKLFEALKATREQRVDKAVGGETSILDVVKQLQQADVADRTGRQMEFMARAARKELTRLGAPHKYPDDTVDQPVLNADTVELADDGA